MLLSRTRRAVISSLLLVGATLTSGLVHSQQPSDADAVKAASKAFYVALNGTNPEAMLKAWAKPP